ncbi:MAG: RNA-binding cell elongation regulator Jag/EloR [Elusimicrobiota bacterium]
MAEIEVEGKTVEEAIKEGLGKLGCSRDKAEIKILDEGTAGLFGLMGTKPSRVRLTTREAGEADYMLAQEKAKEVLADIMKLMKFDVKEIKTAMVTGRVFVNVKSDDSSLIIGKGGQSLEAFEHIVNLILHQNEKTRVKITLDTENYRQKQEERLQNTASKAAAQVKTTGKPFHMDPMSSKDRRLLHLFLKNDPDVETFSEGDGQFRKVIIKPKKK